MHTLRLTDFEAIAFDLEGTLADTLPSHHNARMAAFEQHGFGHITREQHELGPTYGSSTPAIVGGILHAAGEITADVPFAENQAVVGVMETRDKLFKTAAAEGFNAMPGAIDFVRAIAPRFKGKMAIVTSSAEEFIFPFLERSDLLQYFPDGHIIGLESVVAEGLEGKPSGDPYRLAMQRLEVTKLLVFEDTAPGVAAAKKAGATVIALGFDAPNNRLFGESQLEYPPDVVVADYDEAATMLRLER